MTEVAGPGWVKTKHANRGVNRRFLGVGILIVLGFIAVGTSRTSPSSAPRIVPAVATLESQMTLGALKCHSDGATGTVTNHSSDTVSVYIQTAYLDAAGTVLDDGIDNVSGLRPGETAKWEAGFFGTGAKNCRAEISSAFAKP